MKNGNPAIIYIQNGDFIFAEPLDLPPLGYTSKSDGGNFIYSRKAGFRRHQEWPGHANVATHRPSRFIPRDHYGLTRPKSRSTYREDSHRGSIARVRRKR